MIENQTNVHPWDTCTVANQAHRAGHTKIDAQGEDFDVMDCADIELISSVMCDLAEGARTTDCELLRSVVLSLHSFQSQHEGDAIAYWQDKAREWFPEF